MLLLLGLCMALFVTSCKSKEEKKEVETKLLATSPALMDTSITKEYVCQIQSSRHIEIRAQEKGYLENIYVDEGHFVKAGQLLFRIMPKLYEAEKQKAEAEVTLAGIEYQNTKTLADKNVVSPNELSMAKARLDMAKAELALKQVHLQFTEIRAPFDGIIDRFLVKQGSLIDEGELMTSLSDNSRMWVYFNVPETEYLNYKKNETSSGMKNVQLQMANNQLFDHPGVIETIEADFNNETGNISFRAAFPNPKGLLRHGETGNILVTVPVKQGIIIPQAATFEVLDKKFAYVVDPNGVVKSQQITVGVELPHLYTVVDGLSANDKILIDGLRKVKNNDKVKINFQPFTKVLDELSHLHAE